MNIKERIKAKKAFNRNNLWRIRWERIKNEPAIWLFLMASVIMSLIPFNFCDCKTCIVGISVALLRNICYGYIAGMFFYILSDFRSSTKRMLRCRQNLYSLFRSVNSHLLFIGSQLNIIDQSDGTIVKDYENIAKKTVVIGSNNGLLSLNVKIYANIKALFCLIDDEVEKFLLTNDSDELSEDEKTVIHRLSHIFEELHYQGLNSVTATKVEVKEDDLNLFLSSLFLNYTSTKSYVTQYKSYSFYAVNKEI